MGSLRSLSALAVIFVSVTSGAPASASASKVRLIEQRARTISLELRVARDAGELRAARCASSRLSEMHAQLRLAREHAQALASATSPTAERGHRRALEVAYQRSGEIAHEARSCQRQGRRVASR